MFRDINQSWCGSIIYKVERFCTKNASYTLQHMCSPTTVCLSFSKSKWCSAGYYIWQGACSSLTLITYVILTTVKIAASTSLPNPLDIPPNYYNEADSICLVSSFSIVFLSQRNYEPCHRHSSGWASRWNFSDTHSSRGYYSVGPLQPSSPLDVLV